MDFSPLELFGFYGLAVVLIVLFLVGRKPRRKRGFRLKNTRGLSASAFAAAGQSTAVSTEVSLSKNQSAAVAQEAWPEPSEEVGAERPLRMAPQPPSKSLNVFFNYNGHDWDAYEVLGVPAGASIEDVEKAYAESISGIDAASKSFLETALKAIRLSRS